MWRTMNLSIDSELENKRRTMQSEFYDFLDIVWGKGWNGDDILKRTSFVTTNKYAIIEYKSPVKKDVFFRVQPSAFMNRLTMTYSFRFLVRMSVFSYDQKGRKSHLYYKTLNLPTGEIHFSLMEIKKQSGNNNIEFLEFSFSVLTQNFTQITCEDVFVLNL